MDDLLTAGSLRPLLREPSEGRGAFYLSTVRPVPDESPVAGLRDWLVHAAGEATIRT